jgi:hypothetical protein
MKKEDITTTEIHSIIREYFAVIFQ